MRILVLTFYFEPDLSAGSFRATSLAKVLSGMDGVSVDVVTTEPNRYASYQSDFGESAQKGNLEVTRIQLPKHKSDVLGQSRAFVTFAYKAIRHTANREYDLVFATSSRLMTACLGAVISCRKRYPLFLDIRDIFVDTIGDIYSGLMSKLMTTFFSMVERYTIRSASRLNLVSEGFREYFEDRYPDVPLSFHTNGIDEVFVEAAARAETATGQSGGNRLSIVYAGNIGEGQCLHEIVPDLANRLNSKVEVLVIGDGGRRQQLEEAVKQSGCDNVKLRSPVPRNELIECYLAADILFLHLGDYEAFLKVLPSKIFEYAALGKPILAGVAGYSAEFLNKEVENAATFHPTDVEGGVTAFESLQAGFTDRADFVHRYSRSEISRRLAAEIVEVARLGNQ